ncbi:MAG TPA: transketolase [Planctomycetota bacterium]|nr:transketolase [Planctomycetota bacterium]
MRPLHELQAEIPHWEKTADLIDQCLDVALNLSQSGHPGGSRSKVHALVTLLLSGGMRWDLRHPEARFGDRFVLVAGHCNPVVYATLAVFNEALRLRHARDRAARYAHPLGRQFTLLPEDLLTLRQNGGLPGHAEMEGRTLFFKANTGPSGHGAPIAAGEALALKHAGAGSVRVFAMEGEGGHTAGAHHEVKNTAWGLGLGNFFYLLDWNDCGIDDHRISSVVHGTPETWFKSYGWRVAGTDDGSNFASLLPAMHELLGDAGGAGTAGAGTSDRRGPDGRGQSVPGCLWFKTRKGRGYLKYDNASHGSPHKHNDENYWRLRAEFGERHGVSFAGQGGAGAADRAGRVAQAAEHLRAVFSVMERDAALVTYLSDRLTELGESVPATLPTFSWDQGAPQTAGAPERAPAADAGGRTEPAAHGKAGGVSAAAQADPFADPRLTDPAQLPAALFFKPGDKQPNRAGFSAMGAYINALGRQHYGRPLFLVCAADLADSTNISGFGKKWVSGAAPATPPGTGHAAAATVAGSGGGAGAATVAGPAGSASGAAPVADFAGYGWYERTSAPGGAILPQEITEFTNAGLMCGVASVNLSDRPLENFRGYSGACSTYGSFSYLKYGPMRLFSQAAQDSQIRLGRVLWVAGHSGPETAEDSRTHFGIFSPGVTSLFPRGHVINMHPWEANEVPVVLAAAFGSGVPILVLHLTRPPIEIPDRARWGMDSHLEAARGAYILRHFDSRPREGTIIVRGTSSTANLVKLLPWLASDGPNVKIVAAISHALFRRQSQAWRDRVLPAREWAESFVITNTARWNMTNWIPHAVAGEYVLSPDFDDRWRTGGTVDQIVAESRLDSESLKAGILRFVNQREERHERMRELLSGLSGVETSATVGA